MIFHLAADGKRIFGYSLGQNLVTTRDDASNDRGLSQYLLRAKRRTLTLHRGAIHLPVGKEETVLPGRGRHAPRPTEDAVPIVLAFLHPMFPTTLRG